MKFVLLSLIATLLFGAGVPVLQTGQTTVYYTGDDGEYKLGIEKNYARTNDIVVDNSTNLEWLDDASSTAANIGVATAFCSQKGQNWRLPTVDELMSIIDHGTNQPAVDSVFQNIESKQYWSSTEYVVSPTRNWRVDFQYGRDMTGSNNANVICVRAKQ